MILDDATIDRYSRHVLLPEIGPIGQRRLLDARVAVTGDHPAHGFTTELLARSGLGIVTVRSDVTVHLGPALAPEVPPPCIVGWGSDDRLFAVALVGRPCPACLTVPDGDDVTEPIAAQALAALVATTVVRCVVTPPTTSAEVVLDLRTGHLGRRPLVASGCSRCPQAGIEHRWTRSS